MSLRDVTFLEFFEEEFNDIFRDIHGREFLEIPIPLFVIVTEPN